MYRKAYSGRGLHHHLNGRGENKIVGKVLKRDG